ncbi:hypothetical protein IAT40_000911 [Kwoniella sp. CBS 6097]
MMAWTQTDIFGPPLRPSFFARPSYLGPEQDGQGHQPRSAGPEDKMLEVQGGGDAADGGGESDGNPRSRSSITKSHQLGDVGLRSREGVLVIVKSADLNAARDSQSTTELQTTSIPISDANRDRPAELTTPSVPTSAQTNSAATRSLRAILGLESPGSQRPAIPSLDATSNEPIPQLEPGTTLGVENTLPIIGLAKFDHLVIQLFAYLLVTPAGSPLIPLTGMENLFQLYELCIYLDITSNVSDIVLEWMVWLVEHSHDYDPTSDYSYKSRWSLLLLLAYLDKQQLAGRVLASMTVEEFVIDIEIYDFAERTWLFPNPCFFQALFLLPRRWYQVLFLLMFEAVVADIGEPFRYPMLIATEDWQNIVKRFVKIDMATLLGSDGDSGESCLSAASS